MRTSRCSRRACAPTTCCRSPTPIAHLAPNLFSLEMWGGATFDTSMRFLQEDPWERLDAAARSASRTSCSRCCSAPATRSATRTTPTTSCASSSSEARQHGIDVFRIFDSLNWVENMQVAIEAVRERHQRHLRSGHLLHRRHPRPEAHEVLPEVLRRAWPRNWSRWARTSSASRTWPGCASRTRRTRWSRRCARKSDVPIHFHTHDTSGINAGSVLRAADAGVDIADAALASHERHDQPAEPQLDRRGAAAHRRATRASTSTRSNDLSRLLGGGPRALLPVRRGHEGAGTAEVYQHEMPGGQYTNLSSRPRACGLEDRWHEIARRLRRRSTSSSATS